MKTRTVSSLLHALAVGAVVLLAQNAQSQVIVYDSTSGFNGNYNLNNSEVGNEVVLADGSPGATSSYTDYITQAQVQFNLINSGADPLAGSPVGTEEVELNFYQNNGGLVAGYASPMTLIWSSGFSTMNDIGLTWFTEGQTLTYTPNVLVPQDFTWTLVLANIPDGESAGLSLCSTATVGGNYSDAWVYNGSSWSLDVATEGNPALQFSAQLQAVPEPGTIALGAVGVCAFLARRRKK